MKIGARRGVRVAGIGWVAGLAIALGAAVPAGSSTPTVNYFGFMHDVAHSSFSADATSITPSGSLRLAWKWKEPRIGGHLGPAFYATPMVFNHVVYEGSDSGEFYAIDLQTGNVIWERFLGFQPQVTCRPQGIFATATSGTDPHSGVLTIYVGAGDGNVYALRASDGTVTWKSPVNVPDPGTNDAFNYSSPTLANGKIYVGLSSECDNSGSPLLNRGGIVSLDQATGARIATWYSMPSGRPGGDVWSTPAVGSDGSVYVATGNPANKQVLGDSQSIVRLDPSTLARLDGWRDNTAKTDSDFGGSPTLFTATLNGVATPMITACNKDGYFYALRAKNLAAGPVWSYQVARPGPNSSGNCDGGAVWDGHNLYLPGASSKVGNTTYRGSITKVDPANGAVIWATGLPAAIRTYPSLDGAGALVAMSLDGGGSTRSAFLFNASTGTFHTIAGSNMHAVAAPVFADQYLVLANTGGAIYAYQPNP